VNHHAWPLKDHLFNKIFHDAQNSIKTAFQSLVLLAHTYNPSYLGG
jgi:hypothetical protein